MYNGIGLTTPRGSGTNGYIQSNKFFVRPKTNRITDATRPFEAGQGTAGLTTKKPNKDILEHDRKRQIELKLVILEDKLTEQGYTESEIADKLAEARAALESQQEKDEEEGEVIPTPTDLKKFSDTQTHQVAARKEKQMETLKAALGIGLSESATQLTNNRKSNDDDKREHAFLDRDPPAAALDVNELKVKKVDKKKREVVGDEIDESRHRINKKEKKRSRRHDSDTGSDTDRSMEHRKKATRKKKSRKGYDSESDSDDSAGGQKNKKEQKRSRRHDSDTDSDTNSSMEHRKKATPKKKSRKGYDSESDSDDSASGRKKKRSAKKQDRRRRLDSDDSDFDMDNDDPEKRDVDKYRSSHRRRGSSEDDSYGDGGREKKRGEAQRRKIEITRNHRSGRDNTDSESSSDSDRTRGRKKEMVKKGQRRYDTEANSVSDISSDEKVEKGRGRGRRHDSDDDDSDSDNSSHEKVEKGRGRGRRHDSDNDEDSNSSYGRKTDRATAPRQKGAGRRSVSSTDDSDTGSSDEESDSSYQKHHIVDKKNAVDKERSGYRGDANNRGGRGSHQSSQEDKGFASGATKNDDRKQRTLNEDDRSERLRKSENNREMMKGKRKLDDDYNDEHPESKSSSRNIGKEVGNERYNPKDTNFDSESNARAYREKDDRKRGDYSRSVRSRGELDGDYGRQDARIQSKIYEPHHGTRRNDWDYEDRRGGRRHNRDEEEPRGRKHARDEMDHNYRSYERDEEPQHERRRQRKGEEDEGGNKGRVRDRQLDRFEKATYDDDARQ